MEVIKELDRAQSALLFCINFFDEFVVDEESVIMNGFTEKIRPWDTWDSITNRYGEIDLAPYDNNENMKFKNALIDRIKDDRENRPGTLIFDSVMATYYKVFYNEYPRMVYSDTTEIDGVINKGQYLLKVVFDSMYTINQIINDEYGILAIPKKNFTPDIVLKFMGVFTAGAKVTAKNAKSVHEIDEVYWLSENMVDLITTNNTLPMFDILYMHAKESFELAQACNTDKELLN